VTPEYERYAADAAALARIGRAIFSQPTRVKVRIPRALADLALASWQRSEGDGGEAAIRDETPEQIAVRHRSATLALIGLSIESLGIRAPGRDDVLVDLEAWYIGSAFDAAEDADLLADLLPPGRDKGPPASEVFLLWHISHAVRDDASGTQHLDDEGSPMCDEKAGDDVKLLGVYSSDIAARARIESARGSPGFADEPDCFQVTPYTLDKDEWTEGFLVIE
jgi:hypothetical protein